MTRREKLLAELMRWDRTAIEQRLFSSRKWIWRLMDALDGRPLDAGARAWLLEIDQTSAVVALREELGIDDAPAWAGRMAG